MTTVDRPGVCDRSSICTPPGTLGARFFGEAEVGADARARHAAAYAAWRAEVLPLVNSYSGDLYRNFARNLEAADRMHQAIMAGSGDEKLTDGRTRAEGLETFMHGFMAAMRDKIPSMWSLLSDAVVATAKQVHDLAAEKSAEAFGLVNLALKAAIYGSGAYVIYTVVSLIGAARRSVR